MQRLISVKKGIGPSIWLNIFFRHLPFRPVPRQEDFGSDFQCSMLRTDGELVRPYLPFNIQIKRRSDETIANGIRYGGLTKGGNWRRHEILQICQTDTPFLIGLVNTEDQWIDLFSTIGRFFVLTNWLGRDLPRELAFMPYIPASGSDIGAGRQKNWSHAKTPPNFDGNFQWGNKSSVLQ
jgi:hypothetical protein